MKCSSRTPFLAAMGAALLLSACGGTSGPGGTLSDGGIPLDHTLSKSGVLHRRGLDDPLANCTGCHGANLQGDKGPSCTQCHNEKW